MKKNFLIRILAVVIVITLLAPLAYCFFSTYFVDEYIQYDSQVSYADIFYECDESKYPLYNIGGEALYDEDVDPNYENTLNQFMGKFKTLKFNCISPLKYSLLKACVNKKNRYIRFQFDSELVLEKYNLYDVFDEQVLEIVKSSEKIKGVQIFKIFGKAYMFASFIRLNSDDNKEVISAFEISESSELNELMSTKEHSGVRAVMQNPYLSDTFRNLICLEAVALIVLVLLRVRNKQREKYGLVKRNNSNKNNVQK